MCKKVISRSGLLDVHNSDLTPHAACPNLFASLPGGASVIFGVITPAQVIASIQIRNENFQR